ncbi:MAG: hypothetical protein NVS2B4_14730 [Ramlibacter sp.]
MKDTPDPKILWLTLVGDEDFEAAANYLQLLFPARQAKALEKKLRKRKTQVFQAKDVLRASGMEELGPKDPEVAKQLEKIKSGEALSPILLVRQTDNAKLIIADGFHRICAAVVVDPKAQMHCKIV